MFVLLMMAILRSERAIIVMITVRYLCTCTAAQRYFHIHSYCMMQRRIQYDFWFRLRFRFHTFADRWVRNWISILNISYWDPYSIHVFRIATDVSIIINTEDT